MSHPNGFLLPYLGFSLSQAIVIHFGWDNKVTRRSPRSWSRGLKCPFSHCSLSSPPSKAGPTGSENDMDLFRARTDTLGAQA